MTRTTRETERAMDDHLNDLPELEKLIMQRRGELRRRRLSGAGGPARDSAEKIDEQSTEEAILEQVLITLQNERLDRSRARERAADESRRESVIGAISLWVTLLAPVVTVAIAVSWSVSDPVAQLRVLGASAAALGAIAAFIRLAAHRGSHALDGLGKALGFFAAMLAAVATIVLLMAVT